MIDFSNTKAIIFDMDGTILDSMGQSINNRINYLKSLGVNLNKEEISELSKIRWSETVNYINEIKNTNFTPKAFFDGILETHYEGYQNRYQLIDGFLKFLDYLDKYNIKYALATATRAYGAQFVFERFNLYDRFEFIITEGVVGKTKDYPHIYLEAAKRMNSDISETIVFEDALYAINTAKSAGFKIVALMDPFFASDHKQIEKISDLTITDYNHLLKLIKNQKVLLK